jgi:UPF0716 protein FxsA
MPLLLLFIAVPLLEIALFIQLGSVLDLGWILLIVVLTAILGTWLVKQQGRGVLRQIQGSLETLRDPTEPLAHGAMILFSGALLLTPGFFTDTVGFLLLVPAVREAAFRWLRRRVVVHASGTAPGARGGMHRSSMHGQRASERPHDRAQRRPGERADVIEADYEDLTSEEDREGTSRHHGSGRPSGWTRE